MSRRSTPAGIEVACDHCGATAIEPRWWSPTGWLWPNVNDKRIDVCPADVYRYVKETPVGIAPTKRRRGRRL